MAIKTVIYESSGCVRCGGSAGYEADAGESVKIYLNQTRNSNFAEYIEGIITSKSQTSATDTSRSYGIQYDNASLPEGVSEISTCDITGIICISCCELLQEHFDALLAASKPTVSLTYRWTEDFGGVELVATAYSQVPDTTIVSYVWKDANGDVIDPSGPVTQNYTFIDGSEDGGWVGGLYSVLVTDSAGNTATASVHVTLDDRLNALDEQNRREITADATDHVDRNIENLSGTSDEIALFDTLNHAGSTYVRNPQNWGAFDLDFTSISVWNTTNAQTGGGIAITPWHIVHAEANTIADGDDIRFVSFNDVLETTQVLDTVELGATGLMVGVLNDELTTVGIAKILPPDFEDFIDLVGLPVVVVDQTKKALVFEIDSFTDDTITLRAPTDATRANFDETIVTADIGSPVVLFLSGIPILLGVLTSTSLTFPALHSAATHQLLEGAFSSLSACPPNNGGDEEAPDILFPNSVQWADVRDRPFMEWGIGLGVAYGQYALATRQGVHNTAIGNHTLQNVTSGQRNVAVGITALQLSTSGTDNTAIGSGSLANAVAATQNSALGYDSLGEVTSGGSNVGVGYSAGDTITTGSNNVIIGTSADVAAAANSNSIVLGAGATGDGSNTGVFGDSNITTWRFAAGNVGIGGTPTNKLHVFGTATITGITSLTAGTASTTTGTGTLVVTGGVGISGNLFGGGTGNFAGILNATSGTASTTTGTGAVVVTGGVGISGALFAGGAINTTSSTPSSSTTTGSLIAGGGAGIAGALFVGGTGNIAGVLSVSSTTATPAAGSTAARLLFGTTAGFGIYYGSGAPTVSAAQGSLYLRSDGTGTGDRIYVNNSAGSGTTWTALTSAA